MPVHHFGCGAAERHLTRKHFPESHAQRINIGTNIYLAPRALLWTGKYGSPSEGAWRGKRWIRSRSGCRSCQPKSMTLTLTLWSCSKLSMMLVGLMSR